MKEKVWPCASRIGPLWPWAVQAALAAAVRLPRTSSTTLVIVTVSVLAGLVGWLLLRSAAPAGHDAG